MADEPLLDVVPLKLETRNLLGQVNQFVDFRLEFVRKFVFLFLGNNKLKF